MCHICKGLKRLHSLKNLYIDIRECVNITNLGFSFLIGALKVLTSLQTLRLDLGGCDQKSGPQVSNVNKMKSLFVQNNNGPESVLRALKNCGSSLQNIRFSFFCYEVNDEVLERFSRAFKKLTRLQRIDLDLSGCRNITDFGLLNLSENLEN